MALAKALGFQQMFKWIIIGIISIIFLVIFFWQFGQFFIPLLLAGLVVFLLYIQSMQTRKPISPVLIGVLPLGAFIIGYFIQRISIMTLSGSDYISDPTALIVDQTMTVMLFVFILAVVAMFTIGKRRRRR